MHDSTTHDWPPASSSVHPARVGALIKRIRKSVRKICAQLLARLDCITLHYRHFKRHLHLKWPQMLQTIWIQHRLGVVSWPFLPGFFWNLSVGESVGIYPSWSRRELISGLARRNPSIRCMSALLRTRQLSKDQARANAVIAKIEDGNLHAAVRIISFHLFFLSSKLTINDF